MPKFLFNFLFLTILGCVKGGPESFNFEQDQPEPAIGQSLITKKEINLDLDLLLYTFKKTYIGLKYLPQPEVEAMLASISKIRNFDKITVQQFCNEIGRSFQNISDMHLSIQIDYTTCAEKPEPRTDFIKTADFNYTQDWELNFRKWHGENTPVVSLHRFSDPDSEIWRDYLLTLNSLKGYKRLIIDLRQNRGGFSNKALQTVSLLTGSLESAKKGLYADYVNNDEANAMLKNRMRWDLNKKDRTLTERLWARLKTAMLISQEDPTPQKHRTDEEEITKKPPYAGQIYILANHATASSSEYMIVLLKSFSNVKVIGQTTTGAFHYISPGQLQLPYSKLIIHVSTYFLGFKDGHFIEGKGIIPDVKAPENQDSLAWLLRHN